MKNTSTSKYHIKQLLRQFYQIHEPASSPHKHKSKTKKSPKQPHHEGSQDRQQQQDKQHLMRTTSTEIMDSKLRVWEESTLRQIQEKSQGEENSNYSNSIEKYSFNEEQVSNMNPLPTRYTISTQQQQPNKTKPKNKHKHKPKQKNPAQKNSQLVVSLKYEHEASSSKVYHVGMKILNKQWFKCLDNIHKK